MVRRWPLDPAIAVRIRAPEPTAGSPSGKASVCKTDIREFDSRSSLYGSLDDSDSGLLSLVAWLNSTASYQDPVAQRIGLSFPKRVRAGSTPVGITAKLPSMFLRTSRLITSVPLAAAPSERHISEEARGQKRSNDPQGYTPS